MIRAPGADVFDSHASTWAEWRTSPWARLRYRLVAHILDRVLAELGGRCCVLDAGGGDGADSVRLAEAGHEVTVLDHSEPFLRRAEAAAAAAGAGERLRTVRGDVVRLVDAGLPEFDLVLCHNVLQYLTDAEDAVRGLVDRARVGGAVSLLAPNPAMDVLAVAVRETDPARGRTLLEASTVRSVTFDHEMRRLEADVVEQMLVECGCEVTHRFGIRCVSDLIGDNDLKSDAAFAADLERLELKLCDREPYLRVAKFWQLVARRS